MYSEDGDSGRVDVVYSVHYVYNDTEKNFFAQLIEECES